MPQKVFDLTDDLRILYDGTCWTLQTKRTRRHIGTEEEYQSWVDKGYYGHLQEAADHLLEEGATPAEQTDIQRLIDALQRGTKALIIGLNTIEAQCVETPKKIRTL